MKQAEFVSNHRQFWLTFKEALKLAMSKKRKDRDEKEWSRAMESFPENYRKICQHLAIAKSRRYTPGLTEQLNKMVQQGYQVLYGSKPRNSGLILDFIYYGFPAALRSNLNYIWLATALFVLPTIAMFIAVLLNDEIIFSLLSPEQVRNFESMYDPELRKLGRERQSDTDFMMFGFYIYNNIGVSFRCFASGLLFGLGSIFFIAYNGLIFGAVAGQLTSLGFNETFYPFVIGHGSFELTAIVFSGAAGLKIGHALLAPGAYSRLQALQLASASAIKIMYGVILMLLAAAFIEAFWSSSSTLPILVKIGVGVVLWLIVIYYCFFSSKQTVKLRSAAID